MRILKTILLPWLLCSASLAYAHSSELNSSTPSMGGIYRLLAGQAQDCKKFFVVSRNFNGYEAAADQTFVVWGDRIQLNKNGEGYITKAKTAYGTFENVSWINFDNLQFCRKQVQAVSGMGHVSQYSISCVTKDTDSEFSAAHEEFASFYITGERRNDKLQIMKTATPGVFQIAFTEHGNGSSCAYQLSER